MVIQLGEDPWILICLTFLELLFIIIPGVVIRKIEKKKFKEVILEFGWDKNDDIIIKIIAGISIGIIFYFLGSYIVVFFRDFLIRNIFSSKFVEEGQEGAIETTPIEPALIQIIIIIVLQTVLIGPCEETFFRGVLIQNFKEKMKLTYAIIISSFFFALYHVPPFLVPLTTIITFFGYYFSFGILLSFIFIYFDYSLVPCTIAHSVFNILILLI